MAGLAEGALKLRDEAIVSLLGFASVFSAGNAVVLVLVRRSVEVVPSPGHLFVSLVALTVSFLFAMARFRMLNGRPAVSLMAVAAVIHALFAAVCIRSGLHAPGTAGVVFGVVAGYALTMAILLAWCVRVPVRLKAPDGRG